MRKNSSGPGMMEELMNSYAQVYRICLGFSRNPSDAEELLHDVYLRAMNNIDSLRDPDHSREWLFRIARNTCLNFLKKQRFFQRIRFQIPLNSPGTASPEDLIIHSQELASFKECVSRLDRKLKEIFILREYGDLSYQEIAETLGINQGTVMSRLNRARIAVRLDLERRKK